MIGWRGASRYYSEKYEEAFGLECQAIKRLRNEMGLTNIMTIIINTIVLVKSGTLQVALDK